MSKVIRCGGLVLLGAVAAGAAALTLFGGLLGIMKLAVLTAAYLGLPEVAGFFISMSYIAAVAGAVGGAAYCRGK